jgi:hypothetical protein
MNWLARLKNEKALSTHATKPTKPGFVGFVAYPHSPFQKIEAIAGAFVTDAETGAKNQNAPSVDATKPTKPGFVGFVAPAPGASQKIEAKEEKTAPLPEVGAGDTATASRWWRIHYPDRDPVEVCCCPEATHAEILEWYSDALAAEPFTPTIRPPSAPLTASEETAIRAWLALIEETDPATIAAVIDHCQRDADARDYFTGRAAAELPAEK